MLPAPHTCIASSLITVSPWSGTFVAIDEPIDDNGIYHYHPESVVYLRFSLGVVRSMGVDRSSHCYSITQRFCLFVCLFNGCTCDTWKFLG